MFWAVDARRYQGSWTSPYQWTDACWCGTAWPAWERFVIVCTLLYFIMYCNECLTSVSFGFVLQSFKLKVLMIDGAWRLEHEDWHLFYQFCFFFLLIMSLKTWEFGFLYVMFLCFLLFTRMSFSATLLGESKCYLFGFLHINNIGDFVSFKFMFSFFLLSSWCSDKTGCIMNLCLMTSSLCSSLCSVFSFNSWCSVNWLQISINWEPKNR